MAKCGSCSVTRSYKRCERKTNTPQKVDAIRDWHLLLDVDRLRKERSNWRHDITVSRCCQRLASPLQF